MPRRYGRAARAVVNRTARSGGRPRCVRSLRVRAGGAPVGSSDAAPQASRCPRPRPAARHRRARCGGGARRVGSMGGGPADGTAERRRRALVCADPAPRRPHAGRHVLVARPTVGARLDDAPSARATLLGLPVHQPRPAGGGSRRCSPVAPRAPGVDRPGARRLALRRAGARQLLRGPPELPAARVGITGRPPAHPAARPRRARGLPGEHVGERPVEDRAGLDGGGVDGCGEERMSTRSDNPRARPRCSATGSSSRCWAPRAHLPWRTTSTPPPGR